MSPGQQDLEAKLENDKDLAQDQAAYIRAQVRDGLAERQAEIKEPCVECPRAAEWFYPSSRDQQYCDLHVPRGGCSCNIDEDGVEDRDEAGRLLPCVDWMYFRLA